MKAKTPHWDLTRVKALAAQRSIVVHSTRAADFFASPEECLEVSITTIAALTTREYHDKEKLTWDMTDIYGVRRADGSGWYFKICIDEEMPEVVVISFHPLKWALKTNGGVVQP